MVVLCIVTWQDFKYRTIHWVLVVILIAALISREMIENTWYYLGQNFLLNNLFLGIQLTLLSVYFSLKNKKVTNILDKQIGLGDILFLLAISVSFSLLNYVVFLLLGLLFTLLAYAVLLTVRKSANKQIPLAGLLSMVFVVCIVLDEISWLNLSDDTFLINVISAY